MPRRLLTADTMPIKPQRRLVSEISPQSPLPSPSETESEDDTAPIVIIRPLIRLRKSQVSKDEDTSVAAWLREMTAGDSGDTEPESIPTPPSIKRAPRRLLSEVSVTSNKSIISRRLLIIDDDEELPAKPSSQPSLRTRRQLIDTHTEQEPSSQSSTSSKKRLLITGSESDDEKLLQSMRTISIAVPQYHDSQLSLQLSQTLSEPFPFFQSPPAADENPLDDFSQSQHLLESATLSGDLQPSMETDADLPQAPDVKPLVIKSFRARLDNLETRAQRNAQVLRSLQLIALSTIQQIARHAAALSNSQSKSITKPITVKLKDRQGANKTKLIRFPATVRKAGMSPANKLAALLRVIELICENLCQDVVSTKRDIYYRDVKVFKKQTVVDTFVDDLAATLEVRRSDLRVVASAKGLFAGNMIIDCDGELIDGFNSTQGCLVPSMAQISTITFPRERTKPNYILVIEKEAIFKRLVSSGFPVLQNAICITGKGYPDLASRELCNWLDENTSLPIFALMDEDPYGYDIYNTYKIGSAVMKHENENLATSRMQLLHIDATVLPQSQLLPLTATDRQKIGHLLAKPTLAEGIDVNLLNMLQFGYKAEIEALLELPVTTEGDGLISFIIRKVDEMWI